MSFLSRMFIGTDREFAGIEMDAVIYEQYELSSLVTDHPVDEGMEISDTIINQPRIYTIEAVVTDTPMGLLQAIEQAGQTVSAVVGFLRENLLGQEVEYNDATTRSLAAFQSLVALWESKATIEVQTGMGLWSNLAILNIRVYVDQETAGKLHFVTTLRQLRKVPLVTNETEEADLAEGEVSQAGGPVKKEGLKQQVTKIADSVTKSVRDFFA